MKNSIRFLSVYDEVIVFVPQFVCCQLILSAATLLPLQCVILKFAALFHFDD